MKVNIRMVIMSHLSDAQEAMALGDKETARMQVNYAKGILLQYDDPNAYVESKEITELCIRVNKQFGNQNVK